MDVKKSFLNMNLDECIYMIQPNGFIEKAKKHLVFKLKRSIYELKQASKSWNIHFDQVIKSYGLDQCPDEPYVCI